MNERDLLVRLFLGGPSAAAAWEEFLQAYSNLFLKIIWQFEKDRDTVMDMYLHVCSKFAQSDFTILRKFRREHNENPPKFTTWLGAVVKNMCIDAYRATRGRQRIPKALLGFSDLDKKIFELYYWNGSSLEEIEYQLGKSRNGTSESIRDVLERIEASLLRPPSSPATEPMRIRVSYDDEMSVATVAEGSTFDADTLDRWLSRLSFDERLLIQLKFWDDLSTSEIGDILKIDEQRIPSMLRSTLKTLRRVAEEERNG